MLNIHTYIYVVRYYNYLIFMIIVYKIITVTPKQYYNCYCCCTAQYFFAVNGNWENIHFASYIIDPESFNSSKNKCFITITVNNFKKYSSSGYRSNTIILLVYSSIYRIRSKRIRIVDYISHYYSFLHFRILISNLSDRNVIMYYIYIYCVSRCDMMLLDR